MKTPTSHDTWSLPNLFVGAVACLWGLLVWWPGVPQGPLWGDDWAGYLLQALAIRDGTAQQEIALNTVAMQASDTQIGPYGYPWGYPWLLYAAGSLSGWSLTGLKLIGGLSVAAMFVMTFALLRRRVSVALAALGTVLACGQTMVLFDAAQVMSDVPFAALATAAVALMFSQHLRAEAGQSLSWRLTLVLALVGVAAFAVRSNGAVLPLAYMAALGLVALRRLRPASEVLKHALATGLLAAALFAGYFAIWPDGSLVHASYLSMDPRVWVQRMASHVGGLWFWFPFNAFMGAWKLVAVVPAAALLVLCAIRRPWDTALLGIYSAGHLGLLTLFPFDGGPRYYLPLQLPFFMLLMLGASEAARLLSAARPALQPLFSSRLVQALPVLIAAVALTLATRASHAGRNDLGADAPLGPQATQLAVFIDRHVPQDGRIGFFRPRGLRLLTGRLALSISDPAHLSRVDWYVWTRASRDTLRQVPLAALSGSGSGFVQVHEQGPFLVFARQPDPLPDLPTESRTLRARSLLQ